MWLKQLGNYDHTPKIYEAYFSLPFSSAAWPNRYLQSGHLAAGQAKIAFMYLVLGLLGGPQTPAPLILENCRGSNFLEGACISSLLRSTLLGTPYFPVHIFERGQKIGYLQICRAARAPDMH